MVRAIGSGAIGCGFDSRYDINFRIFFLEKFFQVFFKKMAKNFLNANRRNLQRKREKSKNWSWSVVRKNEKGGAGWIFDVNKLRKQKVA